MFITLPLTALMLQLLYARLKQFFFVNHIIFVINVYIAIYLLLLIQIGFIFLFNKTHFGLFSFLTSFIDIGAVFYTYKSMRNFYLQSRLKTLFKCVLLYLMFGIIITLSFLLVAVMPYLLSH